MSKIITLTEAEAAAKPVPGLPAQHALLATGQHQELNWVKFAAGSIYPMHSHPYEQTSVMIQGRMRLTVGDEVREVGPGDMWFAAADVPHGGETLGDETVIFIDLYSPPSGGSEELVTYY